MNFMVLADRLRDKFGEGADFRMEKVSSHHENYELVLSAMSGGQRHSALVELSDQDFFSHVNIVDVKINRGIDALSRQIQTGGHE
jgi:hypothetical protein